jgi:two-component system KDP operon response regulator KdpE
MTAENLHPPLIAVIEDDAPIRKFLRAALIGEGFRVAEAETAKEGLRVVTQESPEIVILDLGLPDRDGKEVIREIRGWSTVPIIILSARDQEQEKIDALDAGADDYLTKPFSVGELLARLRVALRHRSKVGEDNQGAAATIYECESVKVDLAARRVFRDGKEVRLTKLEFDLLATLVRHLGKVLTHRWLLKEVWGPHSIHETHYLRVFVANLRKKLERDTARPKIILTEPGVGYRLADSTTNER